MFTHIPASGKFDDEVNFLIGTNVKNLISCNTYRIHTNIHNED